MGARHESAPGERLHARSWLCVRHRRHAHAVPHAGRAGCGRLLDRGPPRQHRVHHEWRPAAPVQRRRAIYRGQEPRMARGRRQGRLLLPPFGGIAPWEVAVRVLVLPGEGRGRLRQRGTQPACPDVRCHVKKTEWAKASVSWLPEGWFSTGSRSRPPHTRRPSSAIPPSALAGRTGPVFDPGAVTFTGSSASLARSARTPIARDRPETSCTATSRGNVASTRSKSRRRTSTSGPR